MSLREKVGQLFMVGFPQDHLDPTLTNFIKTQKPGGFILFRRNLKDSKHIRDFTSEIDKIARVHGAIPLLAVDQEGGSVTRVPLFPSLPSALSVGLAAREDLARDLGEESGRLLKWHGFNINLAPVLDLSDPKSESFIGSRSFGSDPILGGKIGRAYAEGLRDAGVIPTGKHFPGLGGTRIDLHVEAAGFQSTMDEFKSRDLKPFELFAKMGPFSALMVSQMSYPFLDPSGMPAPFSRPILQTLLRQEMGFEGLVITDDLQMKGSAVAFPARDAALQSLKAGADIVMITWSMKDQTRAMRRVEEAVTKGEWSLSELEDRLRRVLRHKALLVDQSTPFVPPALAKSPTGLPATKRLEKIDLEILDAKLLPYRRMVDLQDKKVGKVCVLTSEPHFIRSYKDAYRAPMRPLLLTNRSSSPRFISSLKSCPLLIFTVNGKRTARVLQLFEEDLRRKTVIVNFGPAGLIPEDPLWRLRLEIGHPHLHTGHRMAEITKALMAGRRVASSQDPQNKKPQP